MSVLSKVTKPRKKAVYRRGFLSRTKVYPDGLFGLELEVEGRGLPHAPVPWVAHNDGSLRGENLEYVLQQPLNFEPANDAIRTLFATFREFNSVLNESNRTSFHVHVNMKKFNIVQTANLITLYGIFENLLLNWCGPYRVGNLFAQRLCDSGWIASATKEALQANSFAPLGNDWRYAAMNLASINKFGSIEFRGMRGITNEEDGLDWLAMLNALAEASKRYRSPVEIVADFSGREMDMVQQIFGTDLANKLEDAAKESGENPQELLWKGVRIVQDIAYALDWEKVLDDLGQPYIPDPFEGVPKKSKTAFNAAVEAVELAGRDRGRPVRIFNPRARAR